MELGEAVRRRRMVRSYSSRPVPTELLDRILAVAARAPSAGFSQGVDLVVLQGPAQTKMFFEATSDPEFVTGPRSMRGLLEAPVIVLPICDPSRYLARYAEADKAGSSLAGLGSEDWPVPYWLVDASFVVMLLLLAATDEGLGALFFRLHRDPGGLFATLGVPDGKQVIGAVALGYAAPAAGAAPGTGAEAAGREAPAPAGTTGPAPPGSPGRRARRSVEEIVHLGSW